MGVWEEKRELRECSVCQASPGSPELDPEHLGLVAHDFNLSIGEAETTQWLGFVCLASLAYLRSFMPARDLISKKKKVGCLHLCLISDSMICPLMSGRVRVDDLGVDRSHSVVR